MGSKGATKNPSTTSISNRVEKDSSNNRESPFCIEVTRKKEETRGCEGHRLMIDIVECENKVRARLDKKPRELGDYMGNVHTIAKTNDFWIKNITEFEEGLKGYVGGENEYGIGFTYLERSRRSKKALINMSCEDFSEEIWKDGDYNDRKNLLEYISEHLLDASEKCIIYLVTYEHANDMEITHYRITDTGVSETAITE